MPFDLQNYLTKYKEIIDQFPYLDVKLVSSPNQPHNIAIASARTCYNSKGLVWPEEMDRNEKSLELRDKIAASTLAAGHLTTRQHAHFVFAINGVSRNVIWQFLHAHPYYNSEQVSQRYVEITGDNWYTLPKKLMTDEIVEYHKNAINFYDDLNITLKPYVAELYFKIHRTRASNRLKYEKDVLKKTMEISRYIMPVSTNARLYHTISALTLYRYVRVMLIYGSGEIIALILKMLQAVNEVDSDLVKEIPDPLTDEFEISDLHSIQTENNRFDTEILKNNNYARLINHNEITPEYLNSLSKLLGGSNNYSYDDIFNADKNSFLSDPLFSASLDPKSRVLNQLHFTFAHKLSHTADSQEQRHRTLPGTRPFLVNQASFEPDYITPLLIKEIPAVQKSYNQYMEKIFNMIKKLHQSGISQHDATYLLPNAHPVRYYESGDYLNFYHKWKARLCYNAQEEIFYSALEEVKQINARFPFLAKYIGPPCLLRNNIKPRCPEGDRYCGVKVWKLSLNDYSRLI